MPIAIVMTATGINCELELAEAFALAGAEVRYEHLNDLVREPHRLDDADLIGLPGGFSYGDAVAAGRIAAHVIRGSLYDALMGAVDRGTPIIAPCNGFQIAVQIGLLPSPNPAGPATPTVALAENTSGRFVDRWTRVAYPESRCIWTKGLESADDTSLLPIAHGEGRFVAGEDQLNALDANGQVAVVYDAEDNPNGSSRHIAGICDPSGLVLGLMPHPERYTRWTQHPWWTRLDAGTRSGDAPGLRMFRNAVDHATSMAASRATCAQ